MTIAKRILDFVLGPLWQFIPAIENIEIVVKIITIKPTKLVNYGLNLPRSDTTPRESLSQPVAESLEKNSIGSPMLPLPCGMFFEHYQRAEAQLSLLNFDVIMLAC